MKRLTRSRLLSGEAILSSKAYPIHLPAHQLTHQDTTTAMPHPRPTWWTPTLPKQRVPTASSRWPPLSMRRTVTSNTSCANGVLAKMYRNGKQHDPITVPSLTFGRAAPLGNSWRMSNDIFNAWRAIWRITNQAVAHSKYNRPGAFADMDMLM